MQINADFLCQSMDWFIYDWDLRHERIKDKQIQKNKIYPVLLKKFISVTKTNYESFLYSALGFAILIKVDSTQFFSQKLSEKKDRNTNSVKKGLSLLLLHRYFVLKLISTIFSAIFGPAFTFSKLLMETTKRMREICSKLMMTIPEQVIDTTTSFVNSEQI